nr:Zinc finger domain containing protein [Haemonchus contortus]
MAAHKMNETSASARPSRRGAQAKKAKTGKRNGRKRQKRTRQSNRKNGDRKNLGDSKLSPPDDDSYIRNGTLDETESLPSLVSFSDWKDHDCTMEELEDSVADREEEGTREDNPAGSEEENVARGNNASEMEEEEVTRGENVADREEEEVIRGDKAADREEEEVTRGDNGADREEEEVTRGDNAANREQEEVARRPPQSTDNGTIDPNNSDPPESNGNSELVASNANTNSENPPSTSPESRKRKPASKSSAKKPKGKKEVKIRLRSLSSKKKDSAAPQNVGNRKSAPSDAGGKRGNHLVGVSDRKAALSKSPPRKRTPMKELEADKTIEHKGQAIRPPTKLTENRACRNDKGTRKSNDSLKSHAPTTHVNRNADYSLTPPPSQERQAGINPTPEKANAEKPAGKTQLASQPPREPTPRTSNGENLGETTQLPSQWPGEPVDRNNNDGRKEQDTVMPPPHNAEGNGRNELAENNDNASLILPSSVQTCKPAQKRRRRRKRKPWNPRPRKTPSVRNRANARPQSDSRLQYQSVQPEQCAVVNKKSHEPVENPGHPGTQAHAPPRKRQRIVNVTVEEVQRAYLIHRGKTLMRVIETNFGRRVYPAIAPHRLRPLARVQLPIYEVERDPYRMYCYCKSSADGGMIGCDGKNCPYGGWFHYSCAGITNECYAPDGKWYCASCSPYYHDMGEPILNCPEEIPLVIVKEEPRTDG